MRIPVALKIIIAFGAALIALPAHPQQPASSCQPDSDALLACVAGLIREIKDNSSAGRVILAARLKEPLEALARKDSYDGQPGDLQALKDLSIALKAADKDGNYDAISVLDNAIGSHKDEIRPALSPRAIAAQAHTGEDIHSAFVQQKLQYLKSAKAQFYDHGPFDLARRSLLAGALEDNYFLTRNAGQDDENILRDELKTIDALIASIQGDEYKTLLAKQRRVKQAEINNHMFWRATVTFLLGETSNMRTTLSKLALANRNFGLETNNSSTQLYIYRVFNEPYKIAVAPDASSGFAITDGNLLRRFYNAAQLAVLVCGYAKNPTDDAVKSLKGAIRRFDPHDYSIVAARASDSEEIKKISDTINQHIQQEKLAEARTRLINNLAKESQWIVDAMKLGASECGIGADDRDRIYSSFSFQPQIRQIGSLWYVVFGGSLSENQATKVSEFIRDSIPGGSSQVSGAGDFEPYAARAITN